MSDTRYCHLCDCRYNPDGEWGYYANIRNDTSGRRIYLGPVAMNRGDCPMCRKPPQLRPDPVASAM